MFCYFISNFISTVQAPWVASLTVDSPTSVSNSCTRSWQDRIKECSNTFSRTGAPHFRGPCTCVPTILWGKSCLLVKIRKTSQNKLVESMHYCVHKYVVCKHEKISYFLQCIRFVFKIAETLPIFGYKNWNRTRSLGHSFWSTGRPHKFFPNRAPHLLVGHRCRNVWASAWEASEKPY